MNDYTTFVSRADKLAKKLGRTRSTISAKLFNDGKKLDKLAQGGELYHSVFIEAEAKLAELEREAAR